MEKVEIWCWGVGDYLAVGESFEECLWEEFQRAAQDHHNEEWVIIIAAQLAAKANADHEQDLINDFFINHVTIEPAFARQLRLFDIIGPGCFQADDALGEAMIKLVQYAELRFILFVREFTTPHHLTFELEACHAECTREVHQRLVIDGRLPEEIA